jgi:hypothetical protein
MVFRAMGLGTGRSGVNAEGSGGAADPMLKSFTENFGIAEADLITYFFDALHGVF